MPSHGIAPLVRTATDRSPSACTHHPTKPMSETWPNGTASRSSATSSRCPVNSMRRFAISGMQVATLGVDASNPSGALRLHESLGYEQASSTCAYGLVGPPQHST